MGNTCPAGSGTKYRELEKQRIEEALTRTGIAAF
jgi:hypothetical protein